MTFSQKDPNVYDFFGGKSYKNTTLFFRLVFEINDDKIAGYIFTDEQGNESEKSIIEGTFNSKTKRIIFTETRKLITRAKQDFEELCYLNGSLLLELNPKISKIKGTFVELNALGKQCNKGKISIISPDSYFRLKKKIETIEDVAKVEKPIIKKQQDAVKKPLIIPSFETDKKITIKDGDEITVYWNSDTFKLEIWDDAKVDDDKVTIKFNEKVVLDKFSIKKKKKVLNLPLKEGDNKIIITANNIGRIGLNTARVDLFDELIKHEIITKLELNKSVVVNIHRTKK